MRATLDPSAPRPPLTPRPHRQDNLLAAVRRRLHASPFEFQDDWVKISDGVDEAVDAWLSANYIMESVVHVRAPAPSRWGLPKDTLLSCA